MKVAQSLNIGNGGVWWLRSRVLDLIEIKGLQTQVSRGALPCVLEQDTLSHA